MKKLILFAALWLGCTCVASATQITIAAQSQSGFYASGLPASVTGTVNTSGTAVTWVTGGKFLQQWVNAGYSGFKIRIGSTDYTVSTTTSTTALTLTGTAGTQTSAAFTIYPFVTLQIYALQAYIPAGSTQVIQSGAPGNGVWYRQYGVSIINQTAYIPEVTLEATTDATGPAGRLANLSAWFYQTNGTRIKVFDCLEQFKLPSTPTTTTWSAICLYNRTNTNTLPTTYYTADQVNALIGTLGVPATRQILTTAPITGGGYLSADLTLALAASGVTAGSYFAPLITVDAYGRITAASNGLSGTERNIPRINSAGTNVENSTLSEPTDGRFVVNRYTGQGILSGNAVGLDLQVGQSATLTDAASLRLRKAGLNGSGSVAVGINETLGKLEFGGTNGSASFLSLPAWYDSAAVSAQASETFSGSGGGARLNFDITPTGSLTRRRAFSVEPVATNPTVRFWDSSSTGQGGMRYNAATSKVQASHDFSTWFDLGAAGGSISGLTANRIPYAASATTLTDTANLQWLTTYSAGGSVFVGGVPTLSGDWSSLKGVFTSEDTDGTRVVAAGFGGTPIFQLLRASGTIASPGFPVSNDGLGEIRAGGYAGGSPGGANGLFQTEAFRLTVFASENWSNTVRGTSWKIMQVRNGEFYADNESLRVNGKGTLLISSDNYTSTGVTTNKLVIAPGAAGSGVTAPTFAHVAMYPDATTTVPLFVSGYGGGGQSVPLVQLGSGVAGMSGLNFGTYLTSSSAAGTSTAYLAVNSSGDVVRGATVLPYFTGTGTAGNGGSNISANSCITDTFTITGAASGDSVTVTPPSTIEAGLTWNGFVSAANTVKIQICNPTSGSITSADLTWRAIVVDH